MADEKIFLHPAENKLDAALQLLAVLLDRLGGEVLIDRKEFTFYEDVPIVGQDYGTHVVLRLGDTEEEHEVVMTPPPPKGGTEF